MNKAVLIMDMPECCWRCKLARKVADNDWDRVCTPSGTYMEFDPVIMTSRPPWCPIRELPEKMQVCGKYPQPDGIVPSYKMGWNACLDVITGEVQE